MSETMDAPIQQVPDDVLREIFMHSLPEGALNSSSEAPLLLCSVCRYWRSLAMEFSPLWTSLKLLVKESEHPRVTAQRNDAMAAWLERYKGQKIDFQLIVRRFHRGWTSFILNDDHLSFFPRALAHVPSYHFRHLTLHCLAIGTIRSSPRDALPSLESLVLVLGYFDENVDWTGQEPIRAFEHCSSLKRVAVSAWDQMGNLHNSLAMPWHQLTHFFWYHGLSKETFEHCVTKMVDLEYAYFRLPNDWSWILPIAATFENLHSFSLDPMATRSAAQLRQPNFWEHFDLPNLQTLRIFSEDWERDLEPGDRRDLVEAFLSRLKGRNQLKKLSLSVEILRHDTVKPLFDCFPHVTHLDLETREDQYEEVVRLLHADNGYLPKLETLVFEVAQQAEFGKLMGDPDTDAATLLSSVFASMVSSRAGLRAPKAQFKQIVLHGTQEFLPEVNLTPFAKGLKWCSASGLVVKYKVRGPGIQGGNNPASWFEREEQLEDWREAREVFASYYYE
ncbi:hypothetical protein BKA70DRAFT_1459215 [Coprinopsis sp. MPI-PUGE-AT-0042]|nr:hypothetical protein BKA70DRAFT_1459215 [Coprinopsis sp. MPI-PUGE-AT-0042]